MTDRVTPYERPSMVSRTDGNEVTDSTGITLDPSEAFAEEMKQKKKASKKKTKKHARNETSDKKEKKIGEQLTATLDWRVDLLGPSVIENTIGELDVETTGSLSTETLLDPHDYDYVALYFVGNYCPSCAAFLPQVLQSRSYFEEKHCKIIVCSNDRSHKDYIQSCMKTQGLSILPYDLNRTRRLRDICRVTSIPALIILENKNFENYMHPGVLSDARKVLSADPKLEGFPWVSSQGTSMSIYDRIIINGRYGQWYNMGHRNVSASHPEVMYVDERNVRIRAGMLNCLSWGALMSVVFAEESIFIQVIFPIVGYEFLVSGVLGLTPLAPLGTLATLLGSLLHPTADPVWKPAMPMRFAWAIGLFLSICCYASYMLRDHLGAIYKYVLCGIILICNFFTWLESAAGFCFGCFLYNNMLVPFLGFEECHACKE